MKRLKNIITTVLTVGVCGQFFACTSSEEIGPANEINDSQGLNIQLEWSTGSSTRQSLSEVDLDLFLLLQNDEVEHSGYYSQFESVAIENFFTDGEYAVNVAYVVGNKALDYTLFVSGASEGGKEILYEGVFAATDQGGEITDITITKKGNKYIIQD